MGKCGGGQEFTQTEKTKLSNIGSVKAASTSSDISITGNNWKTIKTLSGLDSSAAYIVICYAAYSPNVSTAHTPWFRMASYAQAFYCAANTSYPFFIVRYVSGVTSVTLDMNAQSSAITNGKVASGAHIWAIRVK